MYVPLLNLAESYMGNQSKATYIYNYIYGTFYAILMLVNLYI